MLKVLEMKNMYKTKQESVKKDKWEKSSKMNEKCTNDEKMSEKRKF